MLKILGALLVVASFLLAAPVIESGTSGSTQVFQAIGTAEGGGGGWSTRFSTTVRHGFETVADGNQGWGEGVFPPPLAVVPSRVHRARPHRGCPGPRRTP